MGTSGPTSNITLEDTLAVFSALDQPCTPLTATEVADDLGCTRRTAYRKLEQLADRGDLRTKKPGARSRVWWRPRPIDGDASTELEQSSDLEQFGAFVHAVEEYAIFMLDPDGRITNWNAGAEQIAGYDEADIVGEHVSVLYLEHDRDQGVPTQHLEAAAEHGRFEDEYWQVQNDGSEFWAHVVITAIRDDDGSLHGFTMVIRNLPKRTQTEQAVAAERELERYKTLIEESTDVMTIVDAEGTFQYFTPSVEYVLGYDPEELVGENGFDYIHPDDVDETMAEYFKTVENPEYRAEAEFRFRHADGSWIWLEARGRNLMADPEIGGIVTYTRDVTDRKERERELERYRTIIETVTDGVYTVDTDGRFTMVNEAYVEMTGYEREELLGADVSLIVDEEIAASAQALEQELVKGDRDGAVLEANLLTADGDTFPAEATFAVFATGDDEYERVAVVRDITEQKAREQTLEATIADLEATNERLENFASMLAHELRNPVTIGQIYAQQLPTETDSEAVAYVTEAFDRIEDMIDVMLVLTRGRDAVGGRRPVDLAAVAREAWADMDAREATLVVECDRTLQADATYIRHVFRNLFENAVEHGGADVTVTVGDLPTGFYVADDGPGIPVDERDAVFAEGYTTAAGQGGTGLGLAFVRKLAEIYDWEYSVTDSTAGGARFEFTNVDHDVSCT